MRAAIEKATGLDLKGQGPAFLVAGGHAATHWIIGTFYVLLPFIARDLGLSYAQAGTLVTVFHVSAFAANVGSGAVVDIGVRHAVIQAASLIIGALALMAMGLAAQALWLALMVVLIGATNNLWHPTAISYLSDRYPRNRGYALSIHTLGASFGDMLAPVAAGLLLTVMTWRGASLVSAVPAIAVAFLLLAVLGREGSKGGSEDQAGGGIGSYFRRVAGLVRNRNIMGLCTMAGFRSMTQNGLLVFIPLYLADVLKVSPIKLGFALMAMQVGGMIAGPVAGTLSDRVGRQPVVFAGVTATTIIVASLAWVSSPLLFVLLVSGLGFALFSVRPVIHSWAMDLAPRGMEGSVVSLLFGTQSAFSAAVPVVGGLIADRWGLPSVFYVLAAAMLIANLLVWMLPDSARDAAAPAE